MDVAGNGHEAKGEIFTLDDGQLRAYVAEVVRQNVEETLNALLDAEADELCKAHPYERNDERVSARVGHYSRTFQTKAGSAQLKMHKLRQIPFETEIIERYKRSEAAIEESMVEMYLAGVSARYVEDITEGDSFPGG